MILPIFFKRKYLKGRHFENGNAQGYKWAWKAVVFQKILGFNSVTFNFPLAVLTSFTNSTFLL